ncbi:MAG: T9SS type A sorting domain-containing protein [Bacteroidota bacterium]
MKIYNHYLKSISILFCLITFFASSVSACIDPTKTPTIVCKYSNNSQEIELRVSNLKLMTEAPNKVCSCALGQYSQFFTDIHYVVFVLTNTYTPYPNFERWEPDADATADWDLTAQGYGDWSGFVATVINNGLQTTDDVDLVIRASVPAGYVYVDSTLSAINLGTDEFNPVTGTLTNAHRGIQNFYYDLEIEFESADPGLFAAVDAQINDYYDNLTNLELEEIEAATQLYPNPTSGEVWLSVPAQAGSDVETKLYDMSGKELPHSRMTDARKGNDVQYFLIQDLPDIPGIYAIRIQTSKGILTRRITIK